MERIHVGDLDGLCAEFERIRKPRSVSAELLTAPLEVIEENALRGMKLGFVRKLIRSWSDAAGCRLAAWRWLKPGAGMASQEHLLDLQRKTGLEHLDHREFCARLIDTCREMSDQCKRMTRHFEARIAEVEYRLHLPMPGDENASSGFERLQAVLISASAKQSPELAHMAAQFALQQVGALVKHALVRPTRTSCSFDANLMIPVQSLQGLEGRGVAAAERLWQSAGNAVDQYLAVVEETPANPPTYRGFWIPDIRHSGRPLPGAPQALYYRAPQPVFVDDLPPLPGGDEELNGRWRGYFKAFSGDLFISLPVVELDQANAVAVVNVNVRDQSPWYRALSPSWLSRAARMAAPWTVTAWHAFNLAWMFERARDPPRMLCQPRKVAAFVPTAENDSDPVKSLPLQGTTSEPSIKLLPEGGPNDTARKG
jgi:hypothetical protein